MLLLFIPTLSPIFHLVGRGYCYFSSPISFYGICELLRFRYKQLDVLGQIVLFMRKITLRNLSAKYYSNFNYLFALILGIWEVKNQYCKLSCFLSLQDLQNVLFNLSYEIFKNVCVDLLYWMHNLWYIYLLIELIIGASSTSLR